MNPQQHLDDLAYQLFHVFSRTEYALKAAGYNCGEGAAKANWRRFALAVEDLIANPTTTEVTEAIEFIFSAPPKKQMIVDGLITWADVEPQTNSRADKLLQYVRRVRNNLFHGGKFNGRWFAPERSEPLLRHSLAILKAVIEFVPDVSHAYHG
ncbi:hypothetical protein ACFL2Q_03910 [Thermodesulfobacteriota bacterium]